MNNYTGYTVYIVYLMVYLVLIAWFSVVCPPARNKQPIKDKLFMVDTSVKPLAWVGDGTLQSEKNGIYSGCVLELRAWHRICRTWYVLDYTSERESSRNKQLEKTKKKPQKPFPPPPLFLICQTFLGRLQNSFWQEPNHTAASSLTSHWRNLLLD